MDDILGHPAMSDLQWEQATLPMRHPHAGLGLKDPLTVWSPARIAGVATFLDRGSILGLQAAGLHPPADFVPHLQDVAAQVGPDLEPIHAWITARRPITAEPRHIQQKWWAGKVQDARRRGLVAVSNERDRCWLSLQQMRQTTA